MQTAFIKYLVVLAYVVTVIWAEEKHTFTIAADPDYAPFTFRDKSGKAAGLFIDLWRLWAKENNHTVVFRFYDWDETLKATKNGQVDFHSGTSKDYDWMYVSDPIYEVRTAIYALPGVDIVRYEDLKGKKIGTIDKSYRNFIANICLDRCKVQLFDTYDALVKAALEHRIDAIYDDDDALTYYFIRHDLLERFIRQPLVLHHNDTVYAVTNADKRHLLRTINAGLRKLSPRQLQAIENKWLPNISDGYYTRLYQKGTPARGLVYLGVIGFILMIGLLAYLYRLRRLHQDAVKEALKDELTGLYNKRAFDRLFRTDTKSVGLIFVDLDYFKEYNDTYGHLEGDRLLRRVGAVLRTKMNEHILAFRIGGDEFLILTFDMDEQDIVKLCQTIMSEIDSMAIRHEKSPFKRVTITLGATTADLPIDRHQLYHCADKALYNAKKAGKNRYDFLACGQENNGDSAHS